MKKTIIFLTLLLSGCFATIAPQKEPPMIIREGKAPKAALVVYSKENEVASTAKVKLTACLEKRNIFDFVNINQVDKAIKKINIKTDKVFGLKEDEYKKLAADLNVDYILFGNLSVVKDLKVYGWRKDIYSLFYLHDGKTGKKVDMWRSDTIATFFDPKTEVDASKTALSVINHTCTKIIEDF